MANLTLNVIGNLDDVEKKIAKFRLDQERNPIEIRIDAVGDVDALKYLARLEQAKAKEITSENNLRIAVEKRKAIEAQGTLVTNKAAAAAQKHSNANKQVADTTKQVAKESDNATKSLTGTIQQYIQWYLRWTLTSNIFKSIINSFTEAIETLKKVDSALVTVRKTTGYSEEQIQKLTETTYSLASAYGRTADELLNMSATFARAGMGDQLEQMTELSALLQNVGDLSGDASAKFLLAANAAWQLGGNYDALMGIIDGMNAVTNQAAVDMESLTSGITVAGSVFANAGESAQTFTAMVGTAVAATQRSGSEVARGLRTIAMNVRQIKGELEDGEIIDAESISDAAKALDSVGISVADANGELRLTSDVLGDLAGKWDSLTSAEQSYLAQSLAGKRQANVLTALMQNWGEVSRQMTLYANGAGSALKENEIYLDSWEAKTKQLSATWTEFISHFIETGAVKNAISALTGVVKLLDSGVGHFIITAGVLAATLTLLNKGFTSLADKIKTAAAAQLIQTAGTKEQIAAEIAAKAATLSLGDAFKVLGVAMLHNPLTWIAAGAAAIYGLVKLFDHLIVTAEEHAQAAQDAMNRYNELQGEIDSLNSKIAENKRLIAEANNEGKSDVYIKRLETENTLLETQKNLQESLAKEAKEKAAREARAALSGYYDTVQTGQTKFETSPMNYLQAAEFYLKLAENGEKASKAGKDVETELAKIFQHISDNVGLLDQVADKDTIDRISELSTRYAEFNGVITDQGKAIANLRHKYNDARNAAADILRSEEAKKAGFDKTTGSIRQQIAALAELYRTKAQEAGTSFDDDAIGRQLRSNDPTYKKWINLYYTAASALQNMDIAEQRLKAAMGDGGGGGGASVPVGGGTVGGSSKSSKSGSGEDPVLKGIKEQISAYKERITVLKSDLSLMKERGDSQDRIVAKMREIKQAEIDEVNYLNTVSQRWVELGITKADVNALYEDELKIQKEIAELQAPRDELEGLKNIVTLRKDELSFMEASDEPNSKRIAKMKEIQAALHDEAEYIRSTKEYQEAVAQQQKDEKELTADQVKLLQSVTSLSEEWWKYQEKIKNTLSDAEQELKRIKDAIKDVTDDINDLIDAEENSATSALKVQLEYLKKQKEEVAETRELQEKLLAVEKARIALANAQNDRNVRIWNAAAGQWQWVANASNVASAQESLKKAEQDLSDYYRNREISTLERNISAIEKSYDGLRDSIKNFSKAIDKGTARYTEALGSLLGSVSGTGLEGLAAKIADIINAAVGPKTVSFVDNQGEEQEGFLRPDGLIELSDGMLYDPVADQYVDYAPGEEPVDDDEDDYPQPGYKDVDEEPPEDSYDRGGILRGKGGIKATSRDEMVLPPRTTAQLLAAEQTGAFNALLDHLGIVTSAAGAYAGFSGNISANRIGTQNNGDTYNLGGISISESQARGMTVYDLAQMARGLRMNDRIG